VATFRRFQLSVVFKQIFMRKILLAAITTVILFSACQKNDSNCGYNPASVNVSKAKIIGRDLNKCSCCWGWIIEIDNVTYKFDKAPSGSTINLDNLTYPALVNVTWHLLPGVCGNRIELLTLTQ
jgi:hypothetical protein